jgi:hypothetical protein
VQSFGLRKYTQKLLEIYSMKRGITKVQLWEIPMITMGNTHSVDGKYIGSTLGSAEFP